MKIIFTKINSSRARKFQLKTSIVLDGANKIVIKEAVSVEADEHLLNMYNNQEQLVSAYPHLDVCRATLSNGKLHFKFIQGYPLTKLFLESMGKNDKEAFWKLINYQIDLICPQNRNCDFVQTNEFIQIFGKHDELDGIEAFSVCAFDATCNNIILQNGQKPVLIDYEWFWDFPIPKDFLIFHCIYSMYFIFPEFETFIPFDNLAEFLMIKERLPALKEMQDCMSRYFNSDKGNELSEDYILSHYLKSAINIDENKGYLEKAVEWHNENKVKMEQAIAWHNENKVKMEQAIAWHNRHDEQLKLLMDEKEQEYKKNLNDMKEQISKLRAEIFTMENSLSWRITKVLRTHKK